jgi:hypothetical protein
VTVKLVMTENLVKLVTPKHVTVKPVAECFRSTTTTAYRSLSFRKIEHSLYVCGRQFAPGANLAFTVSAFCALVAKQVPTRHHHRRFAGVEAYAARQLFRQCSCPFRRILFPAPRRKLVLCGKSAVKGS